MAVIRFSPYLIAHTVAVDVIAPFNNQPLESWVAEVEQDIRAHGQLSRFAAGYVPVPIFPPIYWDYRCEECRVFVEPGRCRWIEGNIARDGFCSVWTPPAKFERPFTWVTRIRSAPEIVLRSIKSILPKKV